MNGIIYKITCTKNGKVYIGQTIRTLKLRVERHFHDAEKAQDPKIHFQRAIKKYGRDAFIYEKIDEASTQQELNEKEKYWIKFYNSIENGYNTAEGGEGGNTYKGKSNIELSEIKKKISISNSGKNNGMSVQIKCKSAITGEEQHFDTLTQCLSFFHIANKGVIMDRVNNKNLTLWRHEWLFAEESKEYGTFKDDTSLSRRGVKVTLSRNGESRVFDSKFLAMNFLGYSCRQSGALVNGAIINGWTVSF